MSKLLERYQKEIVPTLQKEFKLKNPLAVPKIVKVVVNVGVGGISSDKNALGRVEQTLAVITGQKPAMKKAKKSIADFKVVKGDIIGFAVTLRKKRAFDFLEKLFSICLPRVRDFSGVKTKLDGQGNYTLGLAEQIIFPEIDYDKIDKVRGMEITIVTDTKDDKKAKRLLEELGMPFEKSKVKS